jgi:trigger factor
MQVSVERNELKCRMTVGFPKQNLEQEIEKRIKELARTRKIDGFRPGKVPARLIQQRYGQQVREDALEEIARQSFQAAIAQEKLRPAGYPSIEFKEEPDSAEMALIADFEVYPDISDVKVNGIQIDKLSAQVTDADVENMLNKLRDQRKTWQAVERAAQDGDRLMIDFEGTLEGESEPFNGGTGKDYPLVLGSNSFIPGFEPALIGINIGETRNIKVTFPEDYDAAMAGKNATFKVTANTINEPVLPEITEEFVSAFGVRDGTVESLRKEVRNNMQRELSYTLKSKLKQQVMDALLAANDIPIPDSLVNDEAHRLKENFEKDLVQRGYPSGQLNLQIDTFKANAHKRVKLGILLSEIVSKNGLRPDSQKVREAIEAIAATYEEQEEVIKWFYSNQDNLRDIENTVIEEQVVEWILAKVNVTEKVVGFSDIMDKQK